MPRNTLKTKTETLFHTADNGNDVRLGTGSVLELTSNSRTRISTISCYAEIIPALSLPSDVTDNPDYFEGTISKDTKGGKKNSPRDSVMSIVHRGNGYVTVHLPQKVISRYELRDLLHGLGWRMEHMSLCSHEGALLHSEIWALGSKE